MAHPSQSIPKNFAFVDGAVTVNADIFAVHVLVAADANMTVRAAGIFEQIGVNAGNGTHIGEDGETLGASHSAGFYERLSTVDTTLPCVAGNIIYGDFKRVMGTAGDKFICYLK